jgi:hypothetical protein
MRAAFLALLLAACGGGEQLPVPVNDCAARLSVVQLPRLATAMAAMDGADGIKAVGALFDDQKLFFRVQDPPLCMADGTAPVGAYVSAASCTSTSCTFGWRWAQYRIVNELRAQVDRDGDAVTMTIERDDYHMISGGRFSRSDGSLTMTETAVDGEFRLHEEEPGLDLPPRWRSDTILEYRSIQLDAQGCPIGGSLRAVRDSESLDGVTGDTELIEGTVSFGPACGDVR